MRDLIIHPKDSSTDFLTTMYSSLPDKTVVTGGISKDKTIELINSYDRITMCGHGSPTGLFSVGKFKSPFIIDSETVDVLSKKNNSIFIWCNADEFVNKYKLKGFYSGMFISEVAEANYCGVPNTTQEMIDESNYSFCKAVSDNMDKPQEEMYKTVRHTYGILGKTNKVAFYNWQRLYLSQN